MNRLDPKLLGHRIRLARERKGLGQRGLAELIGRDQSAIYRYEIGERKVPATDIPLLAHALDVSINYFFIEDSSSQVDNEIQYWVHQLPNLDTRQDVLEIIKVLVKRANKKSVD